MTFIWLTQAMDTGLTLPAITAMCLLQRNGAMKTRELRTQIFNSSEIKSGAADGTMASIIWQLDQFKYAKQIGDEETGAVLALTANGNAVANKLFPKVA